MKTFKRFLMIALIAMFLFPVFAEDEEWYLGRPINSITFQGLQNVKEKTASSVLSEYVGKEFSYEIFEEMDALLYAQPWLNWSTADAEVAADGWGVDLVFAIAENPKVTKVTAEGNVRLRKITIVEAQNILENTYFNDRTVAGNAQLVKELYLSKGYLDVQVSPEFHIDEELNTAEVIYNVVEGKQYKVSSILFEGISGLSSQELTKLLSTKRSSFFNSGNYQESNAKADVEAILKYYATKGFPYANILDVRLDSLLENSTEKTEWVNLVFVIEEGDVWTISDLVIDGNNVFSDEELSEFIKLQKGDLYNAEKISQIYNSIASLYYDNGYVYSRVEPQLIEQEGNRMEIHFSIMEGSQTTIEEIRINGLTRTKPYVMERELAVKVGDIFSRRNFIQSQQNMYNTSLLKGITASLYPGVTENGVICEFELEEGNQMELQFGATFGATEVNGFPISGFLTWNNNNLMGTAKKFGISTNLSPTTQSISLNLSDSWFGDKRWSNGISLSFERDVRTNTLQKGIGSQSYDGRDLAQETYPLGYDNAYQWYNVAGQRYPSANFLMDYDYYKFTTGYSTGYTFVFQPGNLSLSSGLSIGLNRAFYDEDNFTPYEKLIQKYNEKWQFSNKAMFTLTWDARNYVSKNPHGYVLSASYTYAGGALRGLSNYNKIALNASAYTGVHKFVNEETGDTKDLILGFTSNVSYMLPQFWNYEGDRGWHDSKVGATKYEMLYIDGMNIGRGFSVVYDQSFLWHNQIDLTYPLAEDVISLEGFVSGTGVKGNLIDLKGLDSINWYMAAGFGIKMVIPGFPLGLYLVKNATLRKNNDSMKWTWQSGNLFSNGKEGSGMSLVLAITTSIY